MEVWNKIFERKTTEEFLLSDFKKSHKYKVVCFAYDNLYDKPRKIVTDFKGVKELADASEYNRGFGLYSEKRKYPALCVISKVWESKNFNKLW